MAGESWKADQRRLRQALRRRRRSDDGRTPALTVQGDLGRLAPPDLLHTASSPHRTLLWPLQGMVRRLLGGPLLEPQSGYNQAVAAALDGLRDDVARLAERVDQLAIPTEDEQADFDYAAFEDRFRGEEGAIERRQREYVDYFFERGEVLDIGCGRGEFLTLLRERDIPARGVDLDEHMVSRCREQGLDVECADAIEYLEELTPRSLGGVFMSQVVEHLETGRLVALLNAIRRACADGAVLIVETINPESLPVLARWFWLDPTHVRLVHPETLQFFMEQAGFKIKTVQFRRAVDEQDLLPRLNLSGVPERELEAHNRAIDAVNARLFGPLDYFVVGQIEP